MAERRQRRFALEGRLPASPGAYALALTVTNKVTHQAFTQSRNVVVPAFDSRLNLSLPMLLTLDKPNADPSQSPPFNSGWCAVRAARRRNWISAARVAHSPSRSDRASPQSTPEQGNLDAVYTLGQLGRPQKQQTTQSVDKGGFDRLDFLIGKDLETGELSSGPYRLVIQVTDPADGTHVSQALNLNITNPRPQ